jgi:hypothetical protein
MDRSVSGPIDDRSGALLILTGDTTWVATFDGISYDADPASVLELGRALWRAYHATQDWPSDDLFSHFNVEGLK